ncbi:cytochrome P450 2C15 [Eurytemora carolleeae]|uniref:cytochrome P450 2C15 n=1 Tax=Eurytemora carolleeae TaxID=1294199 RepID=UPI000C7900C9|nr:cytochrome P450 2C15 [Eurytemora carolleeae]|eukprot:XP_023344408.1 cytochrome P450 2C15-like [Eurytemora affinis]
MMFAVLIAFCSILFGIFLLKRRKHGFNMPSPPFHWLLGHIPLMGKSGSIAHEAFSKISSSYGDLIRLNLGGKDMVLVSGFDELKSIHSSEFAEDRAVPEIANLIFAGSLKETKGVLFNSGSAWKELRRFMLKTLKDLGFGKTASEETVLAETKFLMEEIGRMAKTDQEVDLDKVFNKAALNIIWNLVAGERFDYEHAKMAKLLACLDAFMLMGKKVIGQPLGTIPFLRYFPPFRATFLKCCKGMEELRNFISETIKDHEDTLDPDNPRDFIDLFLLDLGSTEHMDKSNLLISALDLFSAGSETTIKSLMYAVALLVRNPDVQKKVQEELDAAIGGKPLLTMSDKIKLPYTEATILEIWRVGNIVPISPPRRTSKPLEIGGSIIPANTMIISNTHTMHMDPKYWEDPQSFNPSRFINSQGMFVADEKVLAFGTGKRRCLGESLARMENFLFLTNLVQRFSFSPGDQGPPSLQAQGGFTNGPVPFKVKVTPRF